jgi:2-polyprenyl-3-methyl-5-hydroxy-6-metoxy-1,4-benzoquinol methylase
MARITRGYYYEDYKRVYPDGIAFAADGTRKDATEDSVNNFSNHRKFYLFASQFVGERRVADVGCGSGYGCRILKEKGALRVHGFDASQASVDYAKSHYSSFAEFSVLSITRMKGVADNSFDLSVCSEVLEHVKEYGKHDKALAELKRITCDGGLVVVGTPNSEMLRRHGFSFEEIHTLFSDHFSRFIVFENALVPFGDSQSWLKRLSENKTGIIVTQPIVPEETVLPDGVVPEIKKGLEPGSLKFAGCEIDTTLLHNTHSWIIVAANEK